MKVRKTTQKPQPVTTSYRELNKGALFCSPDIENKTYMKIDSVVFLELYNPYGTVCTWSVKDQSTGWLDRIYLSEDVFEISN